MDELGDLVLDLSRAPAVCTALAREKRTHLLYVSLGTFAAVLLATLALWDGLNLVDLVFLAVTALLVFFVVSSIDALVGFDAMNPGLRVFEHGLALPWRTRKDAERGRENVALFSEISEIRVLNGKNHPNLIVVWKERRHTQTFLIESKWIPDGPALLQALRNRVPVREQ